MKRRIYCVDTSALIDGLERYYPEQHFPGLWGKIDVLIADGRFRISEEVWEELQQKDEPAKQWAQSRLDILMIPTDQEVIVATQRVLRDYELLVKNMKGRNRADPFVIGLAQVLDAIVVTGEGGDGNAKRPKIPYVCTQLGVECIRFVDVVRSEGWRF